MWHCHNTMTSYINQLWYQLLAVATQLCILPTILKRNTLLHLLKQPLHMRMHFSQTWVGKRYSSLVSALCWYGWNFKSSNTGWQNTTPSPHSTNARHLPSITEAKEEPLPEISSPTLESVEDSQSNMTHCISDEGVTTDNRKVFIFSWNFTSKLAHQPLYTC